MFNYNNEPYLWVNYRKSNPKLPLFVLDGHIWSKEGGYMARCTDNAEAHKVLLEAGYARDERSDALQYNP